MVACSAAAKSVPHDVQLCMLIFRGRPVLSALSCLGRAGQVAML